MRSSRDKNSSIETQKFKKTDSRGRINLGNEYADKEVKVMIRDVKDSELNNWKRKKDLEEEEHESRKRLWSNTENEASVLILEIFSEDEDLGPKFEVTIGDREYGMGVSWYSTETLEDAIEKAKAYMRNHAYGEVEEELEWSYRDRKEFDRFQEYN